MAIHETQKVPQFKETLENPLRTGHNKYKKREKHENQKSNELTLNSDFSSELHLDYSLHLTISICILTIQAKSVILQ